MKDIILFAKANTVQLLTVILSLIAISLFIVLANWNYSTGPVPILFLVQILFVGSLLGALYFFLTHTNK